MKTTHTLKFASILAVTAYLLIGSTIALAGGDNPPPKPTLGPVVQQEKTEWVLVDDILTPVEVVSLSEGSSVKVKPSGGVTPNSSETVTSGTYSITMVRWLRNAPSGGYNWVDAGGETNTNVTAAQLHLKGRQFYGNPGSCLNGVLWYQPADKYNSKSLTGAVPYATGFGSGFEHCIRNGEHGAKFPGHDYWLFWYTGRTGPFKVW